MPELQRYENEAIRVTYDPQICVHAAECVRGLPRVFDANSDPWVRVANAAPQEIIDQIARCPSKALQYDLPANRE